MPKPTERKSSKPENNGRFVFGVLGILLAVLIVGAGITMWLGGVAPDGVSIGGPFSLTDGDGKRVTDQDLHGKYALVYFGYTFCPDVCPTTLNQVAEAMDRLGPRADRVQPVFITIDPKRDTPPVMKQYVASFGPRIMGLTGTEAEIAAVAKEFRVYYAPHRTGDGPNDYTMDHSSVLYLLGPDGKFISPLRADAGAEQLTADLNKMLN
jgi:protein SCO1/2